MRKLIYFFADLHWVIITQGLVDVWHAMVGCSVLYYEFQLDWEHIFLYALVNLLIMTSEVPQSIWHKLIRYLIKYGMVYGLIIYAQVLNYMPFDHPLSSYPVARLIVVILITLATTYTLHQCRKDLK